jgi:Phosphatidylserine decarboxylase
VRTRWSSSRSARSSETTASSSARASPPLRCGVDVQLQDQFWIKCQPYSLQDMLGNDESARQFVGGTVYQAFLSATNYHRWRCAGGHHHRGRQSRHRLDGLRAGRHERGVVLHDRPENRARLPRRERRGARLFSVRRLDSLPRLPAGRHRRVLPHGNPAAASCGSAPGASPIEARHCGITEGIGTSHRLRHCPGGR